ncbi:MAG: SEC-C metal-binding domain-containing protein [Phycisphaerae bacterium]|jgi:preprotein translocase subunit SecA
MNWLLSVGDTDILRDAVSPAAVFWYRVRQGWKWAVAAGGLTALLILLLVLLILGNEATDLALLRREIVAIAFALCVVVWGIYLGWLLFKFLPSRNDRVVIGLRRYVVSEIAPLEERIQALGEEELRAKTAEFRQRLAEGESLDDVRPEAYACVREASRRARAHRQFECQLIGGRVLEGCSVAEMRTGEGKTIVCYMANYLKVLQGLKVHMVTVNDYLVKRDAEFCRPIFELLGVTVGFISSDMPTWGADVQVRRDSYACDITYGTNSEFGFDYLRDNMKHQVRDQVQGRQNYVVVDEVDSVLIDEARTPLIISGPAHDDVSNYRTADNVARTLVQRQQQANRDMASRIDELERTAPPEVRNDAKFKDGVKKFRSDPLWLSSDEAEALGHMQYFVVELDRKSAHMTEHGAKAAQSELGIGSFYDSKNMNWPHYIDNALRAHMAYSKDKEYVVQGDQIIIVDEFTGRMMHGRQWSDGLHQAVEAKERVTIKQETQTLATITLQNLFKLYDQLAGMTGTAMTEADEFMKIYKLEVVAIPTNKPIRRIDYNDKIYKSLGSKYDAIVEEIRSYSHKGYPSDPWSLQDMLKHARRTLLNVKAAEQGNGNDVAPEEHATIDTQVAAIDAALSRFDGGRGPEEALAEGYEALMGSHGGRPVLVGTASVENSEKISELLSRRYGIEHEVLNAKNHAREAEIVAKAGQQHEAVRGKRKEIHGNVTIATNMAGRGTDIVLGPGVAAIGGLHVVGTERHEARRIDNQLRGRCGRQGDPGSTRFFLALEDELLRLFMGEWMLKMLNMLGFEEGMPLEDRRISKGIERAQKKVEERNFGIRKNLLEYDEVMDYQRKSFYAMRQQVVEGRGLSELIWQMIDESVADAVDRYYDPQYAAQCVVEWVGQHLNVPLEAGKLDTTIGVEALGKTVRDLAAYEVRGTIQRTFGEYVDPEMPPEEWDARGLAAWAAQYGLSLTQNQIRKDDPTTLQEQMVEAAQKSIEAADLTPLEQYCDPLYSKARLVRWARDKFGVDVPLNDLTTANREDADAIFRERMQASYRVREIEYPVEAVIATAIRSGGANVNEVLGRIANWANRKYGFKWTYAHFEGQQPPQVFAELRKINEEYLTGDKLNAEIDAALAEHEGDDLVAWARSRFGSVVESHPITPGEGAREQLRQCAYEMLRYELTKLEQYVLLTTFDAVWKDHMYAMDLLRHGIGLRGYAERDPKIEYKREGTRMFNEMMGNIRERVTDLIFKVQITMRPDEGAGAEERPAALANIQTTKADATGAGFAAADADQQAAMQQQGEGAKPQTIRRETPRVGRNDPCPCGSGKKYKHCHGKQH